MLSEFIEAHNHSPLVTLGLAPHNRIPMLHFVFIKCPQHPRPPCGPCCTPPSIETPSGHQARSGIALRPGPDENRAFARGGEVTWTKVVSDACYFPCRDNAYCFQGSSSAGVPSQIQKERCKMPSKAECALSMVQSRVFHTNEIQ